MGSNISANTLFHFTGNLENMINILTAGFYPRCCMENLAFIYNQGEKQPATTGFAIPMVCFCDIPLSQIRHHVEKYGGYALGLSKEWGEGNGINPVMYVLPDSNAIETIRKSISATLPYVLESGRNYIESSEEMRKIANELIFFSCYLKPYQGRNWNGQEYIGTEIMFYDEKEWRYIPNYRHILEKELKPFIFSHEYLDDSRIDEFNEIFKNHFTLKFKPYDLKYIIVHKESEVLDTAKKIKDMKRSLYQDETTMLITKIISVERLRTDF